MWTLSLFGVTALVVAILRLYTQGADAVRTEREKLSKLREETEKELALQRKEVLEEARAEADRIREQAGIESRERRSEVQTREERLEHKEQSLERRLEANEQREATHIQRDQEIAAQREQLARLLQEQRERLEHTSGFTTEQAKADLLAQAKQDIERDAGRFLKQREEEVKLEADRRARKIVALAIQRCAVDQTAQTTVSTVMLPTDDMKGRIIGREGRNIRAFETLTGVEVIIDDTPEAVVLSAFDPVRREVARVALTNLVSDGRIHPGRIEDSITKARLEIETQIKEAGERAVSETGVAGLHPELIRILGKLKFRTSYGHNILEHSIEMAHLASTMAAELNANIAVAKRAALLHDIGKAVDFEIEGSHHSISVDLARRYGESAEVIHAIEAHHDDTGVEAETVEAVLVQCADIISSTRPGARRDVLETYVKRLQKLEEVGRSLPGIEQCYAVQAGRELRLMVKPEEVDDLRAAWLAREAAKRIEEELQYPSQIKVTVIRETRAVDWAN